MHSGDAKHKVPCKLVKIDLPDPESLVYPANNVSEKLVVSYDESEKKDFDWFVNCFVIDKDFIVVITHNYVFLFDSSLE